MLKYINIFILSLLFFTASYASETRKPSQALNAKELGYHVNGYCDGYPKIKVSTPKGFCVGLIYSGKGLIFPRGVLALSADKILVADMGGWNPNRGRLHLLEKINADQWNLKTILKASALPKDLKKILDRPHYLSFGPDKEIWISSATTIYTLNPLSPEPLKTLKIKIDNLPSSKSRHPLKTFAFDHDNNLYINIGSKSDNCEKFGIPLQKTPALCPEVEEKESGHIRKYKIKPDFTIDPNFEVVANGLRNSMSLAWNSNLKSLFQGENSRDAIQKNNPLLDDNSLPHEELNLIVQGKHYGWPYCYDYNLVSPEFTGWNCQKYASPFLLLPPHSAPLGMMFYQGDLFPAWYKNKLLVALHGYREKGHRLVVFDSNEKGFPKGEPLSLIYDWDEEDFQKIGSPVGLGMMPDGSLLVTEDKSKKVLRLFYDPREGEGKAIYEINKPNLKADMKFQVNEEKRKIKFEQALKTSSNDLFLKVQRDVLDKHCSLCHGTRTYPAVQFLKYDFQNNKAKLLAKNEDGKSYVIPKSPEKSEIIQRLHGKNFPLMPPGGLTEEEKNKSIRLLSEWINSL